MAKNKQTKTHKKTKTKETPCDFRRSANGSSSGEMALRASVQRRFKSSRERAWDQRAEGQLCRPARLAAEENRPCRQGDQSRSQDSGLPDLGRQETRELSAEVPCNRSPSRAIPGASGGPRGEGVPESRAPWDSWGLRRCGVSRTNLSTLRCGLDEGHVFLYTLLNSLLPGWPEMQDPTDDIQDRGQDKEGTGQMTTRLSPHMPKICSCC